MGGIQEDSNEDRSEEAAITETSSGVLVQETFDQEEIPTAEELERRFGDIGLEELRGVESGIAWVMMRELKLVALEKYDLGMYDTEVVLAGEEFKRQSGTFPDGRMRSMYYQVKPLSGGLKELHSVEIHPTESPRIEAREVELLWLRSRIAELSREDPGEH